MSSEESERGDYHTHHELPGGGTLEYRIETDDDALRSRLVGAISHAVGEERGRAAAEEFND